MTPAPETRALRQQSLRERDPELFEQLVDGWTEIFLAELGKAPGGHIEDTAAVERRRSGIGEEAGAETRFHASGQSK